MDAVSPTTPAPVVVVEGQGPLVDGNGGANAAGRGVRESNEDEAVHSLTAGFLATLHKPTDKVNAKLEELQKSQTALINALHEAADSSAIQADLEYIHSVFYNIVEYTYKLEEIKNDMGSINDRTKKIKKKAASLQEKKVNVERLHAERVEKERQRERDLNAKVSLPPPKTATPEGTTASTPPVHREVSLFILLITYCYLIFVFNSLFAFKSLFYSFFLVCIIFDEGKVPRQASIPVILPPSSPSIRKPVIH